MAAAAPSQLKGTSLGSTCHMAIWWRHDLADHVGERILVRFADGRQAYVKVLGVDQNQAEPMLTCEMLSVLDWARWIPNLLILRRSRPSEPRPSLAGLHLTEALPSRAAENASRRTVARQRVAARVGGADDNSEPTSDQRAAQLDLHYVPDTDVWIGDFRPRIPNLMAVT